MSQTGEADAWAVAVRSLPPDATVTMPRRIVLDWLERSESGRPAESAPMLTVGDIARHFHVSASTARGWLADGLSPAARRLPRIGWRLPSAALPELEKALSKSADPIDLSAWRRRGKAA